MQAWWHPYGGYGWVWPMNRGQIPSTGAGGIGGAPGAGSLETLAALREDLVGELQAINQYEAHAARATDPRVRDVLLHIARDEREHVVELLRTIISLDPQQAREFAREH